MKDDCCPRAGTPPPERTSIVRSEGAERTRSPNSTPAQRGQIRDLHRQGLPRRAILAAMAPLSERQIDLAIERMIKSGVLQPRRPADPNRPRFRSKIKEERLGAWADREDAIDCFDAQSARAIAALAAEGCAYRDHPAALSQRFCEAVAARNGAIPRFAHAYGLRSSAALAADMGMPRRIGDKR
jgi:hypothetical protein